MSGTSLDGVDAVLLRVAGSGMSTTFRQLAFVSHQFPHGLKKFLLKNSTVATSRVDEIARLNFLLAEVYADAVRSVARRAHVRLSSIDLIGSHGQTIQHLPKARRMFGKTVRATMQIGDPSVLATLTQITTVGDFRVADMAVGGQGAPLVPFFDWLVFRSRTKNRLVLNIGGIANVTVIPKRCGMNDVTAFDTGPGNMVVDGLMENIYGKGFDRNGETALKGIVLPHLLKWMMTHHFLKLTPPKSTGREEFGKEFVNALLKRAKRNRREDIVATASFFTPLAIFEGYNRFVKRKAPVDEIILSGGGSHNLYFVQTLRSFFGEDAVKLSDKFGIPTDTKEAICFAILANETMGGHAANLPSVTGARRQVALGKTCRPLA